MKLPRSGTVPTLGLRSPLTAGAGWCWGKSGARRGLLLLPCQTELSGILEQPVQFLSAHPSRGVCVRQPVGEQSIAHEGEVVVGKRLADHFASRGRGEIERPRG